MQIVLCKISIYQEVIDKKEGKRYQNVEYIKYIVIMKGCVLYEENKSFSSIGCIRNEHVSY